MDLYGFLWIIVWNLYEICMDLFVWIFFMDTWLEVWNTLCLCRILVDLVVVLNRGKICIEKMIGFRGDVVLFFQPIFLFWP